MVVASIWINVVMIQCLWLGVMVAERYGMWIKFTGRQRGCEWQNVTKHAFKQRSGNCLVETRPVVSYESAGQEDRKQQRRGMTVDWVKPRRYRVLGFFSFFDERRMTACWTVNVGGQRQTLLVLHRELLMQVETLVTVKAFWIGAMRPACQQVYTMFRHNSEQRRWRVSYWLVSEKPIVCDVINYAVFSLS